jgi:hypothetical protein
MGNWVVKQPNDLYAIWSTIVDHFVYLDITQNECETILIHEYHHSPDQASNKMYRADLEADPYTKTNAKREPLTRWKEGIGTIACAHGLRAALAILHFEHTGDLHDGQEWYEMIEPQYQYEDIEALYDAVMHPGRKGNGNA